MGSVKVLAINASPRKYGNSYKLLMLAVEGASSEGGDVEVLHLYDYEIRPCIGCLSDIQKACRPPCVIDDGGREVLEKVAASDVLIISTPIYWYGPPGHLKNLIDRMTVFENMIYVTGQSLVEGKVAGFIASGADSGNITALAHLMIVMNSMGFIIPPWAIAYYLGMGDALSNEESVTDALNVGRLAVITAKISRGVSRWYDPDALKKLGGDSLLNRVREMSRRNREEQGGRREEVTKLLKHRN